MSTIQSGIKEYKNHASGNITDYALFMGGTNVTHDVLACYDPLKTGYARVFMVREPAFLKDTMPEHLKRFKHILQYGFTSISGISDITVETDQLKGGYTGKSFEIPTYATDGTSGITFKVYEFSGSPVREVLHSWVNGATDLLTGLTTFNGAKDSIKRIHANQTAEFIIVNTDNTGQNVEHACLIANCFPKNVNEDVFNFTAGTHDIVETDVEFTGTKYESIQINVIAKALLDKNRILANSLNFYSGYSVADIEKDTSLHGFYDLKTGKISSTPTGVDVLIPQDASKFK